MVRIIKNSCNAGELGENLTGRTDISKYYNGASELVNFIAQPFGGITKRTGTIFVAKTRQYPLWSAGVLYSVNSMVIYNGKLYNCITEHTSSSSFTADIANWEYVEDISLNSSRARLLSFVFSVDDTCILEFGSGYMRFYTNHSRVYEQPQYINNITLSGTNPVRITLNGHGLKTGDTVLVQYVSGTTGLNDREFIAVKIDANNFDLYNTNSSEYSAYTGGGAIRRVYEIASPYNSTEAFEFHYVVSADVIYITHPNFYPRKLSRLGEAHWELENFPFTVEPFLPENPYATKLLNFTIIPRVHNGGDNSSQLVDTTQSWTVGALVGFYVHNLTDGSSGLITANTATTITATLSGGSENDWDINDQYIITSGNGYYFPVESKLYGYLTATGHSPFLPQHTGSLWLLKHTREDNVATLNTTGTTSAVRVKGNLQLSFTDLSTGATLDLQRKEGNGAWQSHYRLDSATIYSTTERMENTYYRAVLSGASAKVKLTAQAQTHTGIVRVISYVNSTTVLVQMVTDIYRTGASGYSSGTTAMWAESAFNEYRGFPRTLAFYEDRLVFASTTNNPTTLWFSKSGEYTDFSYGTNDNDALYITIIGADVSEIVWLAARKVLIAGTASAEYRISAANIDNPVTPSGLKKIEPLSFFGSDALQPVILHDGLFYVQKLGKKLRIMRFAYESEYGQVYKSEDTTILNDDLFMYYPIKQLAVKQFPEAAVLCIRDDGELCIFTYEPAENVFAAWSRFITGGASLDVIDKFVSCAVIPVSGSEDEVWTVVNRDNTCYIEYFAPELFSNISEAVFLDCAKVMSSPYTARSIAYASDTVIFGEGIFGNGIFGGYKT